MLDIALRFPRPPRPPVSFVTTASTRLERIRERIPLADTLISLPPLLTPAGWIPKINESEPPGPAPAGMIWIPGGRFWMGTAEDHMQDARPCHRVHVDGFWMDKAEVTNAEFAAFVKAAGYVTIAERKPRQEDYPQASSEKLVAGSV